MPPFRVAAVFAVCSFVQLLFLELQLADLYFSLLRTHRNIFLHCSGSPLHDIACRGVLVRAYVRSHIILTSFQIAHMLARTANRVPTMLPRTSRPAFATLFLNATPHTSEALTNSENDSSVLRGQGPTVFRTFGQDSQKPGYNDKTR